MKKRVLYLAWAPFFSGAERALLLTLRSLDTSRYEPHVIVGTDGQFAREVRSLGVACDVIPLIPLDRARPLASVVALARVTVAAARIRPAIIHSNDLPSFQPGGYAGQLLRIPAITHVRFPDQAQGYRWFLRSGFSLAIFISHSFRTAALEEAPDVFADRANVLYDAVEIPCLWSPEVRCARRRDLGLPVDRPVVALTGQVAEVKGIWEFVEAVSLLRGTNAVFAVLGDDLQTAGALRRQMQARVLELGLADRVHFLGFRTDAPQICQLFDIVAVPSHVEPFGLASLEAMAAGRPVVASRVGGIPEVVVDGRTGVLVPPRDGKALADGLTKLLRDPEMQRQMGAAGRVRAEQFFGLSVHRDKLHAIYDSLLGARHALPLISSE